LPLSAYETVLRDTPQYRATSTMFIGLPRGGPVPPGTIGGAPTGPLDSSRRGQRAEV
jgi:hypothetical protein